MCGDVPGSKNIVKNVRKRIVCYFDIFRFYIFFYIDTSLRNGPGYVHTHIYRLSVNGLFVCYVSMTNTYVDTLPRLSVNGLFVRYVPMTNTYVDTLRRLSVNGLFVRYVPNTNTYVDQSHSGNFLNQFKYMQPVYVLAKQPADKQTGT